MKLTSIEQLNGAHALDSHAGETSASRLVPDYRSTVVYEGQTADCISSKVYYPRVKKLTNGKYLLLHMDYRLGGNVYYAIGEDLTSFGPRKKLFASMPTVRDDGEPDELKFANGEAAVLADGTLLCVASFRCNKGYVLGAQYGGLMLRRSTDNGETFSEPEIIYVGRNWEPYILVKRDGEVQIYFSHTAPKFYLDPTVRHDSPIKTSSGTAIIRSFDGGKTWTPDVKEPPYAAWRVTQSYVCTMENGTKCFTNQMATAVELGDGSIAIATESDLANYTFRLTLSYTHDNFARALELDEDGPEDKNFAFDEGAGPYMAHLPSGETVLSYNWHGEQRIKLGDEHAKNFDRDYLVTFGGRWGYWGSLFVEDAHTVITAYPNISEIDLEVDGKKKKRIDNDLMLAKLRLNHRMDALPLTDDFAGNTDALFVGEKSQAQCAVRMAHDAEKLYVRLDRLDRCMTAADGAEVHLTIGGKRYTMYASLSGKTFFEADRRTADYGATAETTLFGELGKWAGDDNGAVTLFTLPRDLLAGEKEITLRVLLKNSDGGDLVTEDSGEFPVKIK